MMRTGLCLGLLAACASSSPPPPLPPIAPAAMPAQLASIGLVAHEGAALCPGTPLQMVVTATTSTGQQLATPTSYRQGTVWSEEHGLPWQRFRITANIGGVSPIAVYVPPSNVFDLAEASVVQFQAQDLAQPNLVANATVPVNFKCGGMISFRGQPGGEGANGSAGYAGGQGAFVEVSLGRLQSKAHGTLILARVDGPAGRAYYLLAPGGNALSIDLAGGDGGRGGAGARAALAYSDRDRYGEYNNTQVTYEGPPGPGGAGGPGGTAIIHVDRNDRMLLNAVRIFNPGGKGGEPGQNTRGTGSFAHVTSESAQGQQGPAGAVPRISYEDPATLFADELAQGFPIAKGRNLAASR